MTQEKSKPMTEKEASRVYHSAIARIRWAKTSDGERKRFMAFVRSGKLKKNQKTVSMR